MLMQVEIGNYDSFYDAGIVFSPDQVCRYHINQILNLTVEILNLTVDSSFSIDTELNC